MKFLFASIILLFCSPSFAEVAPLQDGIYSTNDIYCSLNIQVNPVSLNLYAEQISTGRGDRCESGGEVLLFTYLGNGRFAKSKVAGYALTKADIQNCGSLWWCVALRKKHPTFDRPQANDIVESRSVFSVVNKNSFLHVVDLRLFRDGVLIQDWFEAAGEMSLYSRESN